MSILLLLLFCVQGFNNITQHTRTPSTVVQLSYADHPTPPPEGDIVAGSLVVHAINTNIQKHPVLRVLWELTSWGTITVPKAVVGAHGIAQLEVKTLRVEEGVHALQSANLREQGVAVGHDFLLGGPTEAELGVFCQQEQQFQHDARYVGLVGQQVMHICRL